MTNVLSGREQAIRERCERSQRIYALDNSLLGKIAREDVPWLLARVDALETAIRRMVEHVPTDTLTYEQVRELGRESLLAGRADTEEGGDVPH